MIYFYLKNHDDPQDQNCYHFENYLHIKGKDQSILIISQKEIGCGQCPEMTKEDAQALLDSWIDEENQNAVIDNVLGYAPQQDYINLDIYFEGEDLKVNCIEIMDYQRIMREIIKDGDELLEFLEITKRMNVIELEKFWKEVGNKISVGVTIL